MKFRRESLLNCSADKAWEAVTTSHLLAFVARPILTFRGVAGPLPDRWQRGSQTELRLYLFGFLCIGRHRLAIARVDPASREICSEESGWLARQWNHRIAIQPVSDQSCRYSDELEISSGLLTLPITLFAKWFYRHRQKRWQRLAHDLSAGKPVPA